MVRKTRGPSMRRTDRYNQLMQIARQLVAQSGGDALTMTALSELAGVAKPVVYSHFANAGDVIIELLDKHFEQLSQSVTTKVSGARTLDEYISRLVDASFDFENASDLPIRKITNGFSADERVNSAYLRHEEEFVKHWEELLRSCGANERELELAAYAISSMVSNTIYTYSLKPRQRIARETTKKLLLSMIEAVAPDAQTNFSPETLDFTDTRKSKVSAAEKAPKP